MSSVMTCPTPTDHRQPVAHWCGVGLLLGGPALLTAWIVSAHPGWTDQLAWRADRAWPEIWRLWSAAWVHWSGLHLWGGMAACGLIMTLGWALPAAPGAAQAWALAWPLTHLSLWLQADTLHRYGGLSGVLHAGVAVLTVQLLRYPPTVNHRVLGGAMALGLGLKLFLEAPWQEALRYIPELDITVAPLSHAMGAAWGSVTALCLVRKPPP